VGPPVTATTRRNTAGIADAAADGIGREDGGDGATKLAEGAIRHSRTLEPVR